MLARTPGHGHLALADAVAFRAAQAGPVGIGLKSKTKDGGESESGLHEGAYNQPSVMKLLHIWTSHGDGLTKLFFTP
jgi:hypothetical protein